MPDNLILILIFVLAFAVWVFAPSVLRFLSTQLGFPLTEGKEERLKLIAGLLTTGAVVLGLYLQIEQYETSQLNTQLENGFKGLQSGDSLGRVSGIYYLTVLLNLDLIDHRINYRGRKENPCILKHDKYPSRAEATLRALAAAANIFSKRDEPRSNSLINLEAREALRVVSSVSGEKILFDMRGGYFRGANIPYACLARADLEGANFEGANLYAGDLHAADLKGAKFSGANLAGLDLSDTDIKQAIFTEGPNFSDKVLKRFDSIRTELSGAKIVGASMHQANFGKTNLSSVDFQRSYGERLTMEKACLFETKFEGVEISYSSLMGADARGALFRNETTKLLHVDFSNANLQNADFSQAELKEVIFYGANLTGANFKNSKNLDEKSIAGAYLCRTTWLNGEIRNKACFKAWTPPPEFLKCPKYNDRHEIH